MLDKAASRMIYNGGLWKNDVLQCFESFKDLRFDFVLSSDVFVYIGDLAEQVLTTDSMKDSLSLSRLCTGLCGLSRNTYPKEECLLFHVRPLSACRLLKELQEKTSSCAQLDGLHIRANT